MGTVRTERCPDCDALVAEGLLYVHQQQECVDTEARRLDAEIADQEQFLAHLKRRRANLPEVPR